MNVLFVAQNFQIGGIQKALINHLKQLNSNINYNIEVFSFGKGNLIKEIPSNIQVNTGNLLLNLISTPFNTVKDKGDIIYLIIRIICMILVRLIGSDNFYNFLLKRYRKPKKYDIAISYFNDVSSGYFNRGTNLFVDKFVQADKKIAWIHTDPIKAEFDYQTCLYKYKGFDQLVCVSYACKQKFINFLPEYKDKVSVVHNIFPIQEIRNNAFEFIPFKKCDIEIISVGRIDNSTKRFNLIPQICKLLKDSCLTKFYWRIVGDGPDIQANKKLVIDLKVGDVVDFLGESPNPYPFIKQSDLFIVTSAYEGYPMVVGEALILGTPVITTNFAAAEELIKNGSNGLITSESLEDIYLTIKKVLENTELIDQMKKYITKHEYTNTMATEQLLKQLG